MSFRPFFDGPSWRARASDQTEYGPNAEEADHLPLWRRRTSGTVAGPERTNLVVVDGHGGYVVIFSVKLDGV